MFLWGLWPALSNYSNPRRCHGNLWFIANCSEVQVNLDDLCLASEVGVGGIVLQNQTLNLWSQMLNHVDLLELSWIIRHPAGIWELLGCVGTPISYCWNWTIWASKAVVVVKFGFYSEWDRKPEFCRGMTWFDWFLCKRIALHLLWRISYGGRGAEAGRPVRDGSLGRRWWPLALVWQGRWWGKVRLWIHLVVKENSQDSSKTELSFTGRSWCRREYQELCFAPVCLTWLLDNSETSRRMLLRWEVWVGDESSGIIIIWCCVRLC